MTHRRGRHGLNSEKTSWSKDFSYSDKHERVMLRPIDVSMRGNKKEMSGHNGDGEDGGPGSIERELE